ncbi:MAG TPA: ABC transporter permease [Gemmatimonadales bacterium]|nr:ABC transporter permease [Gemmatimonadales bacterium]
MLRRLFRLTRSVPDPVRDLRSEIAFHLEMRSRELIDGGMSPEAARLAALQGFGDLGTIEAECRRVAQREARTEARRALLVGLGHDLRYALRTLRRSPGYTLVALLTLALGIGANTAVFSMIRGVILRPLPFRGGDRLINLEQPAALAGVQTARFSVAELEDYRARARSIRDLVEYHSMPFILLGRGEPRRVQTGVVSANYFAVLGVTPERGRLFREGEDRPGAEPVLVLSHDFWRNRLGGEPDIVGRTFEMNDRIHTVIGVLPPMPQYPGENDVYMPTSSCPFRMSAFTLQSRVSRLLTLFGRLAPGATLGEARNEIARLSEVLHAEHPGAYPASQGFTTTVVSLHDQLTRQARPTLWLLFATAGFVLLIACANVANLTLARLIRRERELALRVALGAGRGRLIRQLLAEGGLLALAAGVLGLGFAAAALELLTAFAARFTPRAGEIALDGSVLAFTLGVALLTGLAFTLLPALPGRRDVAGALKDGGSGTSGGRSLRLRGVLVVAQVAVSVVLLIGAGLMVRSLVALQRVDPGYDTERILTMTLDLNWSRYTSPDLIRQFHARLHERLAGQPGILSAGSAMMFPLDGHRRMGFEFEIEGRPRSDNAARPQGDFRSVSPGYFRTLGIPLVTGRTFTPDDGPDAPGVVLVNQSLARRYWGTEPPMGRRVSADSGRTWLTVVGVVGDVRQYGLDVEPADEVYTPFAQVPIREGSLLVRTSGDPLTMARRIEDEVHAIDQAQPLARIQTLEEVRAGSLAPPRLTASLLGLFALLALVITGAGLAGVIAFSVSQRTQEIGVRMALGAARGEVLGMVLRDGMRLVLAGLVLGMLGAAALTRLMSGLLHRVPATDPVTYLAAAAILLAVAAVACLLPARRAAAVDPMVALRSA